MWVLSWNWYTDIISYSYNQFWARRTGALDHIWLYDPDIQLVIFSIQGLLPCKSSNAFCVTTACCVLVVIIIVSETYVNIHKNCRYLLASSIFNVANICDILVTHYSVIISMLYISHECGILRQLIHNFRWLHKTDFFFLPNLIFKKSIFYFLC